MVAIINYWFCYKTVWYKSASNFVTGNFSAHQMLPSGIYEAIQTFIKLRLFCPIWISYQISAHDYLNQFIIDWSLNQSQ